MSNACPKFHKHIHKLSVIIPTYGKAATTSVSPKWLEFAEKHSLMPLLGKLSVCFSKHKEFFNKANHEDLQKPHVFMNEQAQQALAEFYLCCALRLVPEQIDNCNSDSHCLLSVSSKVATETVEPFLSHLREFVADYDYHTDTEMGNATIFYGKDDALFWHNSFLAAARPQYEQFLQVAWPTTVEGVEPNPSAVNVDENVKNICVEVYTEWLEKSSMAVKGQIRQKLIENGILLSN